MTRTSERLSASGVRRPCRECGGEIPSRRSQFCSAICFRLSENSRIGRHRRRHSKRDLDPRPCAFCGDVFAITYGDTRHKYCSRRCAREAGVERSSAAGALGPLIPTGGGCGFDPSIREIPVAYLEAVGALRNARRAINDYQH